jgi:hypothetical protein
MTSARPLRAIVKWSCSYPWAFGHDVRFTIAKLAARVAASDRGDRGPGRRRPLWKVYFRRVLRIPPPPGYSTPKWITDWSTY